MTLSAEKAIKRLKKINTEEELLRLVKRLDVTSHGKITLLYSGIYAGRNSTGFKDIQASDIVKSLHRSKPGDIRIIDNTEAAKFLQVSNRYGTANNDLIDALKRIYGDDPNTVGSKSNRFLYGGLDENNQVVKGAWDVVSTRFVDETEGAVVTITGAADQNRVFGRTEIHRILANQKITTVDGISHQQLSQLTPDQAFRAVRALSEVRVSEIRIAVDEAGRPLEVDGVYHLDTTKFFADTPGVEGTALAESTPAKAMGEFVPPERLASHVEGVKDLRRVEASLGQSIAEAADASTTPVDLPTSPTGVLLRSLEHVGTAIDVLSLAMASLEAKTAWDRGEEEKARAILMDWVLENGGAVAAGRLAAMATAPLLAAGPLGVLLAAGITVGASVAGGFFGDDLARLIFRQLLQWTDDFVGELVNGFRTAEFSASPIILDLDGNGASTLGESTSGIFFDHDGNGFSERTGWVAPTDVLLVNDLDRNGQIETGAELFGNQTLLPDGQKAFSGFEALKQYDTDLDGRFTPLDPAWNVLRAWRDGNSNAKVDPGELLSLDSVGAAALNLAYIYDSTYSNNDAQGNGHRQMGTYQSIDGSVHAMDDVWFVVDLARTQQRNPLPVPEPLLRLPDLPGIGNVGSLHQEMVRDASGALPALIREWMAADSTRRSQLMESILLHWTGVHDLPVTVPDQDPQAMRRLAALEVLVGRKFRDGWAIPLPGVLAWGVIDDTFADLGALLEDQLIAQVDALPLLRAAASGTSAADAPATTGIDSVMETLRAQLAAVADPDITRFVKLGNVLDRLGDVGKNLLQAIAERAQSESRLFGLQLQTLTSLDSSTRGGDQDDYIIGGNLNEWIDGRQGKDLLSGEAGDDILIGGLGNDSLVGGLGHDVYLIAAGDGADIIHDADPSPGNVDEVFFLDVASTDVKGLRRFSNDLIMEFASSDPLTIQYHFLGATYRIEQFRFKDGVVWGQPDLDQRLTTPAAVL